MVEHAWPCTTVVLLVIKSSSFRGFLSLETVRCKKSKTNKWLLLNDEKYLRSKWMSPYTLYCVKSVQIRSIFWSVFSPNIEKYGLETTWNFVYQNGDKKIPFPLKFDNLSCWTIFNLVISHWSTKDNTGKSRENWAWLGTPDSIEPKVAVSRVTFP